MQFDKLINVFETLTKKMTYLENDFKTRMDSLERQINRLSSKSNNYLYIRLISIWHNITSIINNH